MLSPGFYPIEVEFFEGTCGEGIEISSCSPVDGKWNRIPKSMLYGHKRHARIAEQGRAKILIAYSRVS